MFYSYQERLRVGPYDVLATFSKDLNFGANSPRQVGGQISDPFYRIPFLLSFENTNQASVSLMLQTRMVMYQEQTLRETKNGALIKQLLQERILILDGAMGTMIQKYKLEEEDFRNDQLKDHEKPLKGNNDVLSVTRPDVIKAIHKQYFESGADIIGTNTFSGTTIAQEDYGLEFFVDDINYHSAKIAREVADEFTAKEPHKPRFVAGAIGPTNKSASISPDVNDPGYRAITFEELKLAYKNQARKLVEGGADILLVETIFDTLNAKAAIFGIDELKEELGLDIPIMISGTITDASGRTLSGQTTEAFLISISHVPLLSVGLNCALGAKELTPYLKTLSNKAEINISAYPNAGLPNEFGEYDQTPDDMASQIKDFLDEGYLNLVGGCCGTTPEHIKEIAVLASKYNPRTIKSIV